MNKSQTPINGLLGSCHVLTMRGRMQISELQAGDRIITRSGLRILRELRVTTQSFRAIAVGKGTLGYTRPTEDMLMAPDQEVIVRDWRAEILFGRNAVIMPIDRMIDGKYIAQQEAMTEHKVYELRFDREEIFFADGIEVLTTLTTADVDTQDLVTSAA